MVKSRVYFNEVCNLIVKNTLLRAESLIIECPRGKTSQVIGNKKANIEKLKKQFGFKYIKVVENSNLQNFQLKIYEKEESQCV